PRKMICIIGKKGYFCSTHWEISSVGSEHYLDKVGVTGSSPVFPTAARPYPAGLFIAIRPYPPIRPSSGIHCREATSTSGSTGGCRLPTRDGCTTRIAAHSRCPKPIHTDRSKAP